MEAIASEVACLRRAFPGSAVWGVNGRARWPLATRHGFGFHPRLQLLFRGLTSVLQYAFDINHIFGSVGDWFHLRAVRKRPTVLTVAVASSGGGTFLNKIDRFVVEWPGAREDLLKLGIDNSRINLVFPPVDLQRFRPAPRPAGRFTVLFASSPERADWLDDRGVGLLLEAAQLRPDWRFLVVWRPWGNGLAEMRRRLNAQPQANVEIVVGRFEDMSAFYRQAHVTIAPFLCQQRSKPAPNSIVESLASGRPVVVSEKVGLADLIREEGIGAVCPTNSAGLVNAIGDVQTRWSAMSERARTVAEKWFCKSAFVSMYAGIYRELLQH